MATGTHPHTHMTAGAQLLLEQKTAEAMLRSGASPESSEILSGPPSQPSGRGSAGAAAADFCFPEREYSEGYSEGFAASREQVMLQDGLGAMRGFVFVLSMYLVMGAMALTGLMVWHWLR